LGAIEFGVGGTVLSTERALHRGVVHEVQQIFEQRTIPVAGERENGFVVERRQRKT